MTSTLCELPPAVRSVAFWASPRPGQAGVDWIRHYWASADRPDRHAVVAALQELAPVESLLEIGCHCGPQRKAIHAAFPQLRYVGMDVNTAALDAGQALARQEGAHAAFIRGSVTEDLPAWPSQSFDVVVSSSVLGCVAPDHLPAVLRNVLRIARKAVILVELMADEAHPPVMLESADGGFVEWRHDYFGALRDILQQGGLRWTSTRVGDEPRPSRLAVITRRETA